MLLNSPMHILTPKPTRIKQRCITNVVTIMPSYFTYHTLQFISFAFSLFCVISFYIPLHIAPHCWTLFKSWEFYISLLYRIIPRASCCPLYNHFWWSHPPQLLQAVAQISICWRGCQRSKVEMLPVSYKVEMLPVSYKLHFFILSVYFCECIVRYFWWVKTIKGGIWDGLRFWMVWRQDMGWGAF